jgi:hypothetical protein
MFFLLFNKFLINKGQGLSRGDFINTHPSPAALDPFTAIPLNLSIKFVHNRINSAEHVIAPFLSSQDCPSIISDRYLSDLALD